MLVYITAYYSEPSWPYSLLVFKKAGFADVLTYRYWNAVSRFLDFAGMVEDFKAAPEKSVFVLRACAYNPTDELQQQQRMHRRL